MAQAETGTFEVPLFQRMGLDICNKDVLEIGCGNGFGAYLISKKTPRSYTGLDVMAAQIELAQSY